MSGSARGGFRCSPGCLTIPCRFSKNSGLPGAELPQYPSRVVPIYTEKAGGSGLHRCLSPPLYLPRRTRSSRRGKSSQTPALARGSHPPSPPPPLPQVTPGPCSPPLGIPSRQARRHQNHQGLAASPAPWKERDREVEREKERERREREKGGTANQLSPGRAEKKGRKRSSTSPPNVERETSA